MRQPRRFPRIATLAVGAVVSLSLAGCGDSDDKSTPEREMQPTSTTAAATSPTTANQAEARQKYARELMQIAQQSLNGSVTADDLEAAAEQMNFVTPPVGLLGGHQELRKGLLAAAALSGSAQKAAVESLRTDFRRVATKADPGSA